MARARSAVVAALVLILALGATALAAPGVPPPGSSAETLVSWPPSTGLVIAEIVTGGASASDEYVELANASSAAIDLAGLEVAYVTSTGGTVTRKATWPATLVLEPGRHLLIANSSGIYGAVADATYSGGFAATGGALVVRPVGGQAIDAVGWGDATSAFVEGTAAPAPAIGSSIERRPGGTGGNVVDTNDNAADFIVNGAPACPEPGGRTRAFGDAERLAVADAIAGSDADAGGDADGGSHPDSNGVADGNAMPAPTPVATPAPTPTASPTPSPTVPEPRPRRRARRRSSSPRRSRPRPRPPRRRPPRPHRPVRRPRSIAAARLGAIGSTVTVRGVVVAEAGRLGTPAILVIADATGGLPVRLPDGVAAPARGALLEVRGVLADPYGQIELRASTGGVTTIGTGVLPAPTEVDAGAIGEASEGRLVRVAGTISASVSRSTSNDLAFSITGTDGATLKVLADASAGIDPRSCARASSPRSRACPASARRTRAPTMAIGCGSATAPTSSSRRSRRRPRRPPGNRAATPKGGSTPKPSTRAVEARRRLHPQRAAPRRAAGDGRGRAHDRDGAPRCQRPARDHRGWARPRSSSTWPLRMPRCVSGRGCASPGPWGRRGARRGSARTRHTCSAPGSPPCTRLRTAPTAAVEWRLVKLEGTVADVHRNGDRWSAELQIAGGAKVPVSGLAGSGIASTAMIEGRTASVIGIVKRPYPTATDRRFALVPRRTTDIALGKAVAAPATGTGTGASLTGAAGAGTSASTGAPIAGPSGSTTGGATTAVDDIDLRDIAAHLGKRVRVGGLVTDVGADGVRLDDGTSGALIVLEGDATDLLTVLEPGDALNATGTPDQRDETVLVVADAADIELVGDLGVADPASTDGVGLAAAVVEGTPTVTAEPGTLADASTPATAPIAVGAAILALLVVTAAAAPLLARRQRRRRASASHDRGPPRGHPAGRS